MKTLDPDGLVVSGISALSAVDRVEPLAGGFAPDDVYVAWEGGVRRYVLRVGEADLLPRRRAEAEFLVELRKLGLLCSEPVDVGLTHDGSRFYSVVRYIPGEEARAVIETLTLEQQFNAGMAAGEQLRIIHSYTPRIASSGWQAKRVAKHQRKLAGLKARSLAFDGQDRIDEFVEAGWGLIEISPFRLQHDDFQLGNIIIRSGEYAGVIDFGNWDTGDPIEDFYKLPWMTTPQSVPFGKGQVQGYLANGAPANFWPRYNLFVALGLYSSLLWAAENGVLEGAPKSKGGDGVLARERIAEIVETHDFKTGGPPSWFKD